jgi:lipoprotein LprG
VTRTLGPVAATLLALLLTACGGDDATPDADQAPPAEVLAEAKTILDDTSGVQITLEADDLSSSVTGIRKATGVGIHPPAFQGSFDLSVNGLPATADVIAVDGTVYAKNSLLLPEWTAIDPGDYGAPDPNLLMGDSAGFSTLLTSTVDPEMGDQVRGGSDNSEILTSYTGTVPGDVVANIVPSASGDFDASYTISDDGELREAELTGVFYEDDGEMTYTMSFSDYGTEQDITAP